MLKTLPAWQSLEAHRKTLEGVHMRDLFAQDPERFNRFSCQAANLLFDFSKNILTEETLQQLLALAEARDLTSKIQALFAGDTVNLSEQRAAGHTFLRAKPSEIPAPYRDTILATRQQMATFTRQLHEKRWLNGSGATIRDIVHLGIGGSYLGPKVATEALRPFRVTDINVHFVANIDGNDLENKLNQLQAETTLFIVASKSFGTQETLENAKTARQWLKHQGIAEHDMARHFVAISANVEKAVAFGIAPENVFPMWDWVGGRYSLWSAIGLPVMISIGEAGFNRLLKGARLMDEHFRTAELAGNMPVLMALINLWYINFFGADSRAVLPYDHHLRALPAHLQQLEMESMGKGVTQQGNYVDYRTGSIIWGGVGANGQHAYHQLLHQGTHVLPVDFILPMKSVGDLQHHHRILVANCLSQAQALMQGKTEQQIRDDLRAQGKSDDEIETLIHHKAVPGNRPSNTITYDQTTPETVGALIALYEHKVFVNSVIWDINPFDQWGVELGKELSAPILDALNNPDHPLEHFDNSTEALIRFFRTIKGA